jgi:two-component system response regulator GlrR
LVKRALRSKTEQLQPFSSARNQFEFQYLLNLLHTTQGNVTQAAKLAQRNRSEFYKLLRKHHLVPESFREEQQ